ncbi:MAG: ABC transporter ATP-binding protein [Gemmatimonadetes bacterium]|nr:ABC transporter ATP-binding protein [Gemmatimonadota bacterium]
MNSSDRIAVECRDVAKRFYYYEHRDGSLREWFVRTLRGRPRKETNAGFHLDQLNVSVSVGESVALIGSNGSGKSTALRIMAGIYSPTAGSVRVNGRMTAVIELGAGFHPELSGRENVSLSGAVIGMKPGEMESRLESIIAFAELGDFIDTPVKYYSSGMRSRLAFAVSTAVNPDVALLDEILAVGDATFRKRCLDWIDSFRARGGTLVFVSHDLDSVIRLADRVIWMDAGSVRAEGDPREVVDAYLASVAP